MPKNEIQTGNTFIIEHKKDGNANILTFIPQVANEGYPPQSIEVTDEQWNALQYHFAKLINDKEKLTRLAYIY